MTLALEAQPVSPDSNPGLASRLLPSEQPDHRTVVGSPQWGSRDLKALMTGGQPCETLCGLSLVAASWCCLRSLARYLNLTVVGCFGRKPRSCTSNWKHGQTKAPAPS